MCYNKVMNDAILTTIISSSVTLIVAYFGFLKFKKEYDVKNAVREQKQSDRLDRIDEKLSVLTKKIDIHNGYGDKIGQIREDIALIKKDIEYLKKG